MFLSRVDLAAVHGNSQLSRKSTTPAAMLASSAGVVLAHRILTSAMSVRTRRPVTGPIDTASPDPAAGIECCDCGLDRGDPVEIEAPRLVHSDTFVEIPEDALFAWLRHQ